MLGEGGAIFKTLSIYIRAQKVLGGPGACSPGNVLKKMYNLVHSMAHLSL